LVFRSGRARDHFLFVESSVASATVVARAFPYRLNPVSHGEPSCERRAVIFSGGGNPTLIEEQEGLRAWVNGFSATTGCMFDARSTDGDHWTPNGWDKNHMVSFDRHGLPDHYSPAVIRVGGQYWMFYSDARTATMDDAPSSIRRMISEDGLNWREEKVVLEPGPAGDWDAAALWSPAVMEEAGVYRMWYTGSDGQGRLAIGHATSSDGTRFVRDAQNPVFEPGAPGAFDDLGVSAPEVRRAGERYYLWYTAETGGGHAGRGVLEQLALATSADGLRLDQT
jgi:hypothetical protein